MADRKRRILVVDDDLVIQRAFLLRFKRSNYEVITVSDGSAAVNLARTEPPDAIFLDVSFPTEPGTVTWDGFGILTWLKRMETLKQVPIFIISGSDSPHMAAKAKELGAVDFYPKPVDYPALLAALDKIFASEPVTPQP